VPHVRRWLRHFDRKNFLFLILEEDVSKPQRAKRKVSDFLGVSASDFPERLRRRDLDWVVRLTEQAGAKRIFGRQTVEDRGMEDEIRSALNARLLDQVPELEKLIDRDISVWQESQEN
jgi:hypothetical protein